MTIEVCNDVNVFLDPVRSLKAAPTRITPHTSAGMLLLLAINKPTEVRLNFGEHIATQIVRALTKHYGWTEEEATKWAETCRGIAKRTGGTTKVPVESDPTRFARLYGMSQVPDREDCNVVDLALKSRSKVLVTSDRDLLHATVEGLDIVHPDDLVAQLRAAWAARKPSQPSAVAA